MGEYPWWATKISTNRQHAFLIGAHMSLCLKVSWDECGEYLWGFEKKRCKYCLKEVKRIEQEIAKHPPGTEFIY